MSAAPQGSKLAKFLNHRVHVAVSNTRYFHGQLLGFDSHSNLILKDCEEFRTCKKRRAGKVKEQRRNLGLMILRGETVKHIDVVGPPPPSGTRLGATMTSTVVQPGGVAREKGAVTVPAPVQPSLITPGAAIGAPSINVIPPSKLPP